MPEMADVMLTPPYEKKYDKSTFRYWLPKIMNGGIAGIVGVSCVYPADLIKTRLQNSQPGPDGRQPYKGFHDCFKKTVRREGVRGLYRGYAVNVVFITPEKTIKLVCNDYFRYNYTSRKTGRLSLAGEVAAGASAGMCQIIVTTPMEFLKIQQQDAGRSAMLGGEKLKTGAFRMCINIIKEKGIFGLYKGNTATLLRDVYFSAIYFPLFARLNRMGRKRENGETVFYHSLLCGVIAGGVASLLVNPLDVVKTRLQTINKGKTDTTYFSVSQCMSKILRTEGPDALRKGAMIRIAVIGPLFGIAQAVYYLGVSEALLDYLNV